MQSNRDLGSWVQVLTGIAVVVGVVLVIVELRQVQTLARAQLTSDTMIQRMNIELAAAGENPAVALSKACLDPESLRPDEMRALDAYLYSRVLGMYRFAILTYRDGLYTEEYLSRLIPGLMRTNILETAYGRAWFKVYADENIEGSIGVSKNVLELGLRALNEAEPVDCQALLNSRLRSMEDFLERPTGN